MKKNKKQKIIFMIVLTIGIIVRIYKLYDIPNGFHVDEAGMFVDACMISKFGVDRHGVKFPIYLENFGGGQSIMYAYLTALLIKIIGCSYSLVRVISVIFGILVIIFSYLISKEFLDKKESLLIMTMVSLCPYFIQASRIGLDCNLLLGMSLISIYLFIKAIQKEKQQLFILSGIFFGLCFYTYAIAYIYIPIMLFLCIIYLIINKKIKIKNLLFFIIPIVLLATPLVLFIMVNYGIINEMKILGITISKIPLFRSGEIKISNFFTNIFKTTDLLSYDMNEYNALPLFGTIYYTLIPFYTIGTITYTKKFLTELKNKIFNLENIIYISLLSNYIIFMIIEYPNINKLNSIYFSMIYITLYGIKFIKKQKFKRIIKGLLIMNFICFSIYYFKFNNKSENRYFDDEIYKIVNNNYELINNKEIVIESKNSEKKIYEQLGRIKKTNDRDKIIKISSSEQFDLKKIYIVDIEEFDNYKKYFENKIIYEHYVLLYNNY